jgi:HlyD family secretion protein
MNRLIIAVAVASIASACSSDDNTLQGYVEGEFVYISSPVSGKLQTLQTARGMQVATGAALFELDAAPQTAARDAALARVAQAQASLRDARKGQRPTEIDSLQAQYQQSIAAQNLAAVEYTRQQQLFASRIGSSQQDVDRARTARDQATEQVAALNAQLKTARLGARPDQVSAAQANADALQAQLTQAEWEFAQTRATAPSAGLIADTLYRSGEWVVAGKPVVVLLPPGNVKVRVFVPEAMLSALQLGADADVIVAGRTEALHGKIAFIAPKLEFTPPVVYTQEARAKFVALVEIAIDAETATQLHPGQPVDVRFAAAT